MFDSTVEDFMKARESRQGKLDHLCGIRPEKLMTDATSFDILKQPPYYEKLNYVIPAERKTYKNYDDCDEIRRVIDLPYFEGQTIIDNLFNHRDPNPKYEKFTNPKPVPLIRPKADYR